MNVYFLLYLEDTKAGSASRVELFLRKPAAQKALKTAYTKTLWRLHFDTTIYSASHYCGCNDSTAIITDGEDNYSWSIGVRGSLRDIFRLAM